MASSHPLAYMNPDPSRPASSSNKKAGMLEKQYFEPSLLADHIRPFVKPGYQLGGIQLGDVNTTLCCEPKSTSITDLIRAGGRFFDIVVWHAMDCPDSKIPVVAKTREMHQPPTLDEVGDALFFVWFYIVTQARVPEVLSDGTTFPVPKYLRDAGLKQSPRVYLDRLATFNLAFINPTWARHVAFDGITQDTMNRHGVNVAGYRLLSVFKLYTIKSDACPDAKAAGAWAFSVASGPTSWQIHPLTRPPELRTPYGDLGDNLNNLILECFTETQIEEMLASKRLVSRPISQTLAVAWRSWTGDFLPQPSELIFRRPSTVAVESTESL